FPRLHAKLSFESHPLNRCEGIGVNWCIGHLLGGQMKRFWKSVVSFDSTSEARHRVCTTAAWFSRAMTCATALFMAISASSLQIVTVAQTSATPAAQKAAGEKMSFEVASVKPAAYLPSVGGGVDERTGGPIAGIRGGCLTSMKIDRARVDFKCATLTMLI